MGFIKTSKKLSKKEQLDLMDYFLNKEEDQHIDKSRGNNIIKDGVNRHHLSWMSDESLVKKWNSQ